jgi:hypothetical protein
MKKGKYPFSFDNQNAYAISRGQKWGGISAEVGLTIFPKRVIRITNVAFLFMVHGCLAACKRKIP